MKTGNQISEAALAVLSECTTFGQTVKINSGQLERPLYKEVDEVLRAIGGKWNTHSRLHVFTEPDSEIADMLEGCIQTGIATPLRPNGYFVTPDAVACQMMDIADIRPGMFVLEPSAGSGDLADHVNVSGVHLVCIEQDPKLVRALHERFGHLENSNRARVVILEGDFLTYPWPRLGAVQPNFDRVLMNPPFIRLSEITHILHAWDCLKPGGRLVSVASASINFRREPRAVAFRTFVKSCGRIEELPEGSFKESGTMVNSVLVILNKGKR